MKRMNIITIGYDKPQALRMSDRTIYHADIRVFAAYLENGEPRWFSHYGTDRDDQFYCDLTLSGYISSDQEEARLSSWEMSYTNMSRISLRDAERIVKTLKRLRRGIEKLGAQCGIAQSFGQQAVYFANVIKAQRVYIAQGQQGWKSLELQCAPVTIDALIRDIHMNCRLEAGNWTEPVVRVTDAPEDYDGFGTETEKWLSRQTSKGDRLRKVQIQGKHYTWQVQRYGSGRHFAMSYEEFCSRQSEFPQFVQEVQENHE